MSNDRVTHRARGTIPGCIPASRDKGLLELAGIRPRTNPDGYCDAISAYLVGNMDEFEMNRIMARHGNI